MQAHVREIHVNADVRRYILQVVRTTREHPAVTLGVSPRGRGSRCTKAAQALAALRGRDFVTPGDVQALCPPVVTQPCPHQPANPPARPHPGASRERDCGDSAGPVIE
jgi:MoxR-like ATPase